jgi:hypothetical protein
MSFFGAHNLEMARKCLKKFVILWTGEFLPNSEKIVGPSSSESYTSRRVTIAI